MQVRGGQVPQPPQPQQPPPPGIFPQLRADLQYPEAGARLVAGGHYYDPRFGYVVPGSAWDLEIARLSAGRGAASRQSTLSQDRSSGVHSLRSSLGSGDTEPDTRHRDTWRGTKQTILRQAEHRRSLIVAEDGSSSGGEEEAECRGQSVPRAAVRRAGSVGSLGRRSRGGRTSRHLQRRSRGEDSLEAAASPQLQPGLRSVSAEAPPPPPPRDLSCRPPVLAGLRATRPVSYSFEHLRGQPQPQPQPQPPPQHRPLAASSSHPGPAPQHPPLPPRRPASSLQLAAPPPPAAHSTPLRGHEAGLHCVDSAPRSRRPILCPDLGLAPAHSAASSEGIGSQTSLEDSCHLPRPGLAAAPRARYSAPPVARLVSGQCSPASVSSKDSGCSATSDQQLRAARSATAPAASPAPPPAGFSTAGRRSRFQEAILELEAVCSNIAADEELLDRAERRDLPTAHQLLIWRDREAAQLHTSAESSSQLSDIDNCLNWNTSSSFEHISAPAARTPGPRRRSGVSDKVADDMAVRRMSAANKVPSTVTSASMAELANTSYLAVPAAAASEEWDPDSEPDIRGDDSFLRNLRDANQIRVIEPQPKFGVPLGPVTAGAASDYLHAVPGGKYRSTFNRMRHPDLVKDDLAFRHLRKDEQLSDPGGLGIVKDPHGVLPPASPWPPSRSQDTWASPALSPAPGSGEADTERSQIMRSLSENIAQIIRKQSAVPGASLDTIITYEDLQSPAVYTAMRYTMDLITQRRRQSQARARSQDRLGAAADGVYQLLRHRSEPDISRDEESEDRRDTALVTGDQERLEAGDPESDEGLGSVSSPDLGPCTGRLPDLVSTEAQVSVALSPSPCTFTISSHYH